MQIPLWQVRTRFASSVSLLLSLSLFLFLSYLAASAQNGRQTPQADVHRLEVGKPIEREMKGGELHAYEITLAAGQYLDAVVEQKGIDVVIVVVAPDGKPMTAVDSPNGTEGPEPVAFLSTAAGVYRLIVKSFENDAPVGKYEIRVKEIRPATEKESASIKPIKLEVGKPIEWEMKGGESYSFEIALQANQYMDAFVLPPTAIDVAVIVIAPDGKPLMEVQNPDGMVATPVHLIAETAGNYMLLVISPDRTATVDRYEIRVNELRAATRKDRALMEVNERLLEEATELRDKAHSLSRAEKYDAALLLAERVLAIYEKVLGAEHPEIAVALRALAEYYRYKEDYERAELLLVRALTIAEKVFGAQHAETILMLNDLAWLYIEKRDYKKAEPLLLQALSSKEKILGSEHPDTLLMLHHLAVFYNYKGDYAKAEAFYLRALAITERAFGAEHPEVTAALSNLATFYEYIGDYAKAEPLLIRALAIVEKVYGAEQPLTASLLSGLAWLYQVKGEYEKAESLYVRALAIQEKAIGKDHPSTAATLNNLANLYQAMGNFSQAIALQSRCNEVMEKDFTRNLALGSERQRLYYLNQTSRYLDFTLSLHTQFAPTDLLARQMAIRVLLQRKGRALDATSNAIAVLRRHASADDQKLLDQLADVRSQLSNFALKGAGKEGSANHQANVELLEDRVEALEYELSRRSAEFRAQAVPVTLEAVQAAVPQDAALIEFAAFRPYDAKTRKYGASRYVVYLLTNTGEPQWADLGEAAIIDKAVKEFRSVLRQSFSNINRDVLPKARTLDELVMRPVRALIGDKKRLLISPDGALNLIPFDALVDEKNRYLVESYSISYLTSGRDLLRLQAAKPNKKTALIFADPDFDNGAPFVKAATTTKSRVAKRVDTAQQTKERVAQRVLIRPGPRLGDVQLTPFKRLPGSAKEGMKLKKLLPDATVLTAAQATETALKRAASPSILHISTHGGFLEDKPKPESQEQRVLLVAMDAGDPDGLVPPNTKVENPLLRSGLFFAGANTGKSGDDDGVLTALEAAGLDLYGTELVVLSACDTGVGEVKNGDGVYGLRRAFVLAGAETQVMSLWPISDEGTRELMIEYYQRLLKGEGRGEALRQVRLKMLASVKHKHPYFWASFIQSGEWANLAGKR